MYAVRIVGKIFGLSSVLNMQEFSPFDLRGVCIYMRERRSGWEWEGKCVCPLSGGITGASLVPFFLQVWVVHICIFSNKVEKMIPFVKIICTTVYMICCFSHLQSGVRPFAFKHVHLTELPSTPVQQVHCDFLRRHMKAVSCHEHLDVCSSLKPNPNSFVE